MSKSPSPRGIAMMSTCTLRMGRVVNDLEAPSAPAPPPVKLPARGRRSNHEVPAAASETGPPAPATALAARKPGLYRHPEPAL
eukprot:6176138-Pyramimonas_sp.AAC.1